MKPEKSILMKKAHDGYTFCFVDGCPLKEQCLHWQVGEYLPHSVSTYRCINAHFEGVGTAKCTLFRSDQKVRFAQGMSHVFNDDMPKRLEPAVRQQIISLTNRTYYYEYRNGTRLISPTLQEQIRTIFRENGWTGEIQFDTYIEDYNW